MNTTYILIDTALMGELREKLWLKKERRPSWIAPIYGRYAVEVSPVIIDIEQAFQCSRIGTMMRMVNAQRPQLGVSFIETNLTLHKVVNHLRKFIFVRTDAGTELTLRFADCAVLPTLATVFSPAQWAAMTSPFRSWKVHDRDGNVVSLKIGTTKDEASLPLLLSDTQITALKDSMAPDQLLINLSIHRRAPLSAYITSDAHGYAEQSLRMWHAAGRADDADLILFASGVFDTQGRLLGAPELPDALANTDVSKLRIALQELFARYRNTYEISGRGI
jgi:hypothetical protein